MSTDLALQDDDVQMPAVTTPAQPPVKSAGDWRTESIAHTLDEAYKRASTLELTVEEAKQLGEDFTDDAFSLGAGGDPELVYIEHAYLRERLNSVLGVGSSVPIRRREWTEQFQYMQTVKDERGRSKTVPRTGVRIYVDLVLLVRGCVVGEAIGDSVYFPHNSKTNYSDALESAKSNAFRRCCKEFGVGLQAWKKAWVNEWKQRLAAAQQQRRTEQRRPKQEPERPQQNFTPPADWPNTTVEDLKAWIDTLQSSAAMKFACVLLFGEDTPLINMRERDPLIRHLHAHYHARLDGMSAEVKEKLAEVTREIDGTLSKHELDVEAHEAFG